MSRKWLLITSICSAMSFYFGYEVYFYRNILMQFLPTDSDDLAVWLGALGSVGAVFVAIWIMHAQYMQSERRSLDERRYVASKEACSRRERMSVCLIVVAHTAAGIVSILEVLEKTNENDLPWTLENQANFIAGIKESAMRIPIHELTTAVLALRVLRVLHLARRLEESILVWRRHVDTPSRYVSDLRETVALLKPEAAEVLATIEQSITDGQ